MTFSVQILGNSTPYPTPGRFTSSQVINIHETLLMIDCGEGAQVLLHKYRIKRNRIKHLFISHLHGDHYFGIFGLLGSFSMMGRVEPLHIHCPKGLEQLIKLELEISNSMGYPYEVIFHFTNPEGIHKIVDEKTFEVFSFPLIHRVPTTGFLVKEKEKPRKMIKSKIEEFGIHFSKINGIKSGDDFITDDGNVILNEELTLPAPKSKCYAYCSDTQYNEAMIPVIKNADLIYHEATFSKTSEKDPAAGGHSTAEQAAQIASLANVGKLVLGHFSTRYKDLNVLLEEAQVIFPNTYLGLEGEVFRI